MTWIAKPIAALSSQEIRTWTSACTALRERGRDVPLAQTLTWAQAAEASCGGSFLVSSLEEGVGGIVLAGSAGRFECINGPLLDWDRPAEAARQVATFAMAVSKLDSGFRSLILKPRWIAAEAPKRLAELPISAFSTERASTIRVRIASDEREQLEGFSPRLRRTLKNSERLLKGVSVTPWLLKDPRLAPWVEQMEEFAQSRGFSVPPRSWFELLLSSPELHRAEQLSFLLAFAETGPEGGESSFAEHFLCRQGSQAHYLFGCERRSEDAGGMSAPALAHVEAMRHLRSAGVYTYDLMGYVKEAPEGHPYSGVSAFKEQFQGEVLEYVVPEFRIE